MGMASEYSSFNQEDKSKLQKRNQYLQQAISENQTNRGVFLLISLLMLGLTLATYLLSSPTLPFQLLIANVGSMFISTLVFDSSAVGFHYIVQEDKKELNQNESRLKALTTDENTAIKSEKPLRSDLEKRETISEAVRGQSPTSRRFFEQTTPEKTSHEEDTPKNDLRH